MNDKYNRFFKGCPNPDSVMKEEFDEDIKDIVCKIKDFGCMMKTKEFEELYEKYKDNPIVRLSLVRCDDTPISVRDEMLIDEIRRPIPDDLVCFEHFKHYIPSITNIQSLVDIINDDILKNEFKTAYEENRKTVVHQDTVRDLQNICPNKFSSYHFCHSLVSSSFLSKLMFDTKNNEQIVAAICNNRYMKDTQRDKFFDIGCNFNDITNPTEYMVGQMYTACVETIFDIDDPLHTNLTRDAYIRLSEMFYKDWLNEDLLTDLAIRITGSYNTTSSKGAYTQKLLEKLGRKCKYENVLRIIEPYAVMAVYNPNTPKDLVQKKIDIIVNHILSDKTDIFDKISSIDTNKNIGFDDDSCFKIIDNTPSNVYERLLLSTRVSSNVLKYMQNKQLTDRGKHICNMHIKLKEMELDDIKYEYILNFFTKNSSCFDISNNPDVGIKLTTDEYNKLHEIIEAEISQFDLMTEQQYIKHLLNTLESAYIFRDLSVDFPNLFVRPHDVGLLIPTANDTQMVVLKPELSNKEKKEFFSKITHPDTLMATIDEIYYTLDSLADKVTFYENIDKYIDIVDNIQKQQKKLSVGLDEMKIQYQER